VFKNWLKIHNRLGKVSERGGGFFDSHCIVAVMWALNNCWSVRSDFASPHWYVCIFI